MAMAFRSLVVAIKAAVTTLASAVVGFAVLTLVIQLGHGMGVIGLDRTGPIESFVPPIAFAILFGLSMDYEVFLMSRIREEHVHGSSTFQSVRDGMAGVGRVIVAAALIMSAVFFAFLLNPDRVSKEFGLLLGVAILTDALIIRLTLVPALLSLLGDRSWTIPRLARPGPAQHHDRAARGASARSPADRDRRAGARHRLIATLARWAAASRRGGRPPVAQGAGLRIAESSVSWVWRIASMNRGSFARAVISSGESSGPGAWIHQTFP